jgi:hypothetical protein
MSNPAGQIVVAGRVNMASFARFQDGTACSTRVYAEERGMRASGRLERGEVRSLLGFLAQKSGFKAMFRMLEELGDAAIIDTRVLFAHLGLRPSRADRYAADIMKVSGIESGPLQEFAMAAASCRIPLIMGGHSLVSSGLLLLLRLLRDRGGATVEETYREAGRMTVEGAPTE